MSVLEYIQSCKNQHHPLLAVLIDPDKTDIYPSLFPYLQNADMVFVGGSTGSNTETCIDLLRQHTSSPIVLFPGNIQQFTPKADALLFLTLLNARVPEILINPHIEVAQQVLSSGIESIPMGYILIDGNRKSSVEIATNCTPIPQTDVSQIISTAVAGQLLGKSLIYLEAGSGAKQSIDTTIIRAVSNQLRVPLIVGGGICTPKAMIQAFDSGADIVVIGNHFERFPDEFESFMRIKQERYAR